MKTFPRKVNWTFQLTLEGHGRNCKEALLKACKNEIMKIDNDYMKNDYEQIEKHNVIHIDEDGSQYGFEE